MIDVKICGLSTSESVDAAVRHRATHVGFVFFTKSPRNVAAAQIGALAGPIPPHVRKIGVFVDPGDALLDDAIRAGRLDAVQLHKVTPARAAAVAKRVETWVAIAVRTAADLAIAPSFAGAAHRLLYDAKTPNDALPGGMGLRFDWQLLQGFDHPLPWALSGGLDADNLPEAVRVTGAQMVDVSSGVESAPGVKDVDKIAAFLHAARQL
ncbi:N-(5'-phosphoribosyl)anthranilate isomerase [Sphingomonas antarctica]|uniref:phosphoribosylanthranilate isomerase n=1 Tax=Sphingomonas antarctica TaxID=2040274 RepID=UPI0039EA2DD5